MFDSIGVGVGVGVGVGWYFVKDGKVDWEGQ
jgi:hypothetical protein